MSWLLLPLLLLLASSGKRAAATPAGSDPKAPAVSLRGQARGPVNQEDDRELRAVLTAVAAHHASRTEGDL
jgi:Na+-transporting methylmalonyl-CoA/oxaloacetate decarboxylase gamma subunit